MPFPRHTYILLWEIDIDGYTFSQHENVISKLNKTHVFDYSDDLTLADIPRASDIYASMNHWQQARRGDRFFMYVVSRRPNFKNRIVSSGFLYSNPINDNRWSQIPQNVAAYTVDLDFDVMLNPRSEFPLLEQESLELQFPDYDWSGGETDFMLDRKTAYLMEQKWYHYLLSLDLKCEGNAFWCPLRGGIRDMYNGKPSGNYPGGRAMRYRDVLEKMNTYTKL